MIRVETFETLPAFPLAELTEHSLQELQTAGELSGLTGARTAIFYDDQTFLLSASILVQKNFFAPAEIFLLVGKAYSVKYVRQTKQVLSHLKEVYPGFRTLVDVNFQTGCRFAKFFGFKERGTPFDFANRRFQMYEVY